MQKFPLKHLLAHLAPDGRNRRAFALSRCCLEELVWLSLPGREALPGGVDRQGHHQRPGLAPFTVSSDGPEGKNALAPVWGFHPDADLLRRQKAITLHEGGDQGMIQTEQLHVLAHEGLIPLGRECDLGLAVDAISCHGVQSVPGRGELLPVLGQRRPQELDDAFHSFTGIREGLVILQAEPVEVLKQLEHDLARLVGI